MGAQPEDGIVLGACVLRIPRFWKESQTSDRRPAEEVARFGLYHIANLYISRFFHKVMVSFNFFSLDRGAAAPFFCAYHFREVTKMVNPRPNYLSKIDGAFFSKIVGTYLSKIVFNP